jgi:hypothetical protein
MADTEGHPYRTLSRGTGVNGAKVESCSKRRELGVDVGEHVSLRYVGKAARGQAMTANRIREIRPSGMIGGLVET